jgi:threonine synthase
VLHATSIDAIGRDRALDLGLRGFEQILLAARFDDDQTLAEIGRVYRDTGMLLDPHTATGTAAARALRSDHPVVTLATAHPAKFPAAVHRATGIDPALPPHLADLFDLPEHVVDLPLDLAAVQDYVSTTFAR